MHSLKFLPSPPTTDWSSTIAREFRKEPLDQLKVLLAILVSPILRGNRHRIDLRIPAKHTHLPSRMPFRTERTGRVIQASRRAAQSTNRSRRGQLGLARSSVSLLPPARASGTAGRQPRVHPERPR